MTASTRNDIRDAVRLACRYWPNAHLGDCTVREDIRGAFSRIRAHLRAGQHIQAAIGALEADAYRHADM